MMWINELKIHSVYNHAVDLKCMRYIPKYLEHVCTGTRADKKKVWMYLKSANTWTTAAYHGESHQVVIYTSEEPPTNPYPTLIP